MRLLPKSNIKLKGSNEEPGNSLYPVLLYDLPNRLIRSHTLSYLKESPVS